MNPDNGQITRDRRMAEIAERNNIADLKDKNVPDRGRFLLDGPIPIVTEDPVDEVSDATHSFALEELPLSPSEAMDILETAGFLFNDDEYYYRSEASEAFEYLSDLAQKLGVPSMIIKDLLTKFVAENELETIFFDDCDAEEPFILQYLDDAFEHVLCSLPPDLIIEDNIFGALNEGLRGRCQLLNAMDRMKTLFGAIHVIMECDWDNEQLNAVLEHSFERTAESSDFIKNLITAMSIVRRRGIEGLKNFENDNLQWN